MDTSQRWGIRRAVRRRFPQPAYVAGDPAHTARLDVYLTDMLRPYDLALEPGALDRGRGQSYGEMSEALVESIVEPGDAVDLLILVYAIPDITPGRATATYLSHICPGNPMAFAICDQGTAGAFTGLRLVRDYAAAGVRRALLVIVEQAELPYDPGVPVDVPTGHAAVALLFGDVDRDGAALAARLGAVRNRPEVDAVDVRTVLADEVAGLSRDGSLILGAPLAGQLSDADRDIRMAPPGQPFTGVWWTLAGQITEVRPAGGAMRIVLADYDAQLRYLSVAAIDVADINSGITHLRTVSR
jgi:4-hydroxymandelate oxidase